MIGCNKDACATFFNEAGRHCAGCDCACHRDSRNLLAVDPRNLKAVLMTLHDRLVQNCRYSPQETRGGKSAAFIRRFAEDVNRDSTIRLVIEEMGLSWPMPDRASDVARFGQDYVPGGDE